MNAIRADFPVVRALGRASAAWSGVLSEEPFLLWGSLHCKKARAAWAVPLAGSSTDEDSHLLPSTRRIR